MIKFLAVVKREYLSKVRTKFFVIMTVLGPLLLAVVTVVPGLLFQIGGTTRLAIIDQTEGKKLSQPVREALLKQDRDDTSAANRIVETANSNTRERLEKSSKSIRGNFTVEEVDLNGRSLETVKRELNERIRREELDGYLVFPADILDNSNGKTSYFGRNVGDVITRGQIEQRLNSAVRRQRLIKGGVKEADVDALSKSVDLAAVPINEKGQEGAEDSGAKFAVVFVIAFLIYMTILLYGQVVLGAIVEEKETRIAEILFSSVRPFTLMFGKLIGVSLMALTQMAIWVSAFVVLGLFLVPALVAQGKDIHLPELPPAFFALFFLFFVLGYFLYATLYVFIGSMVTTAQEGGQMAMPVIFLLVASLYMAFPVIRSPNSTFAFWVSMVPFFSPITMLVRIVSQRPPVWQIALSLFIGYATVVLFLWMSSRIYRVGMLMYGKKATIPEVWRWLRQA